MGTTMELRPATAPALRADLRMSAAALAGLVDELLDADGPEEAPVMARLEDAAFWAMERGVGLYHRYQFAGKDEVELLLLGFRQDAGSLHALARAHAADLPPIVVEAYREAAAAAGSRLSDLVDASGPWKGTGR
jgi:hypothetical protein